MKNLILGMMSIMLLSGCGAGSGKSSGDTTINCSNSQTIILRDGFMPTYNGDATITGDVSLGDGTHAVTVSGCNIEITGDTTTDSHDSSNDSSNHDNTNP